MSATCGNCRWWEKKEAHHTYGNCRRMPPAYRFGVFIESRDRYSNPSVNVSTGPEPWWPNTHETDWCGEHQPKETRDEAV